jgi:hypothetical protein
MQGVKVLVMVAVSLLAAMVAEADPNPQMKEDFAEWLTPEKCQATDPAALFQKFGEEKQLWASEQGQDAFYEVYAGVLAKHTDVRHPEVAKFRKPLLEAYQGIFDYIRTANGYSGTAHVMRRLPAEVEWDICLGFEKKFEGLSSGKYTSYDIRELARLYKRKVASDMVGVDLRDLEKAVLEPTLAKLKTAEQGMSKEAALYFRARLVRMLAEFLARGDW